MMKGIKIEKHPFYKICVSLCRRYTGTVREKKQRRKLRESLCMLAPLEQPMKVIEAYYIESLEWILTMICTGIVLTAAAVLSGQVKAEIKTWTAAGLLLVLIVILLIYAKEADLEKEVKARNRQLEIDYPEIIHKLTLLLLAGITVKEAWEKITMEYTQRRKAGSGRRYAYEEMLLTYREMQGGMIESEAYDRFGRRCRLSGYLKLSSLLNQNVRTGSRGLLELLTYEGVQAMEERKNLAKRMGEEASTKLLIPMMLMLMVVIVILVVPAFMTMQL